MAARSQEDIGVILLDVMLPGKDGFEIVRTLREHKLYFPVLMLTARSNPQDVLEGLNAGADDYLPKPFDLDILLVRIKSILRRATWYRPLSPTPPPPRPSSISTPSTIARSTSTPSNSSSRRAPPPTSR